MTSFDHLMVEITPHILLKAYARGLFPMAESAFDTTLYWIEPRERGVLPLNAVHIPKRLRRTVRQDRFRVMVDHDYDAVIAGCAGGDVERPTTWINRPIRQLYRQLFEMGHCHTVEVYQGPDLVGGLYGVELGGAFFGESMFSTARDASKVALVHLVARLISGGYRLLDTQFTTEHLEQFGTVEVPRDAFLEKLDAVLPLNAEFRRLPDGTSGIELLEIIDSAKSET